jgi:macrolide-specific efflux system membrane fusion protein
MKINSKSLILVGLTLMALFLAASFVFFPISQAQNSPQVDTKFNPKKDKTVLPKHQNLTEKITLAGSIDATAKTDVRFQTSGMLSWVGVKVGDRVKKGQALASLDRRELKKQLEKQFNDYRASLHNFNDVQDKYKDEKERYLLDDEMRRILDRSQFTLNNAVIDYELAEITLKYATVVSPIEGIVVHLDQPLSGVNVTPATSTITIVDPKSIYFKSEIDEDEVNKISLDQETKINLDSFPESELDSKVNFISFTPISGRSSTVYEVRFNLPVNNQNLQYRLGMNGDANIILSQAPNSLTIPLDALIEQNDQTYVLIKDGNNSLALRQIKTGIEGDDDIQVLEGLTENNEVVIKGK